MHSENNTILIAHSNGISVIDINSITRIEAVSNYSRIFLADGKKILVCRVLKQVEEMLAGKGFTRVHRSHLVNTAWIKAYLFHQLKITLHNQEQVSISRRRKKDLRKAVAGRMAASLN